MLQTGNNIVSIGAQDISTHDAGAFTGEVSGKMIRDTGAEYVIVGHSERRMYHNETNEIVAKKASNAIENNLIPIICIGETIEEKEAGQTLEIIESGLRGSIPTGASKENIIIAYEPRWAIGAGLTPTSEEIKTAHNLIAKILESMNLGGTPVLYGASVNGDNANEIMSIENVDGVLVGGASLKSDKFIPIIEAV
jgi:triosephosphate isomerase